MPTNSKLRRTLALLLAGGSLAIGVPAALAAGGGDDGNAGDRDATAPSSGFVQDEQNRPDRDCPERGGNGNGGGSGDEGGGSSGGSTTTPSV
jgi:hypothetical protein